MVAKFQHLIILCVIGRPLRQAAYDRLRYCLLSTLIRIVSPGFPANAGSSGPFLLFCPCWVPRCWRPCRGPYRRAAVSRCVHLHPVVQQQRAPFIRLRVASLGIIMSRSSFTALRHHMHTHREARRADHGPRRPNQSLEPTVHEAGAVVSHHRPRACTAAQLQR